MYRLGGVLPNDNALHRMEVGPGATFLQTVRGGQESAQPHTSSHQSLTTQPAPALATLSSKLILLLSQCWRLCDVWYPYIPFTLLYSLNGVTNKEENKENRKL